MEEDSISTEIVKRKKQIAKSAFYLPFGESLLQSLVDILKFLKCKLYTQNPHDSSSATTTAGSAPPPTAAADPATSQTSRAVTSGRSSRSRGRVKAPPRSRGGGGQINKDTSDSILI